MAFGGLRIVVFPETGGRWWTARCLERDIAAQGRSVESAVDALLKIASAHIAFDRRHNRDPLSAFPAAPRRYWQAFSDGTELPSLSHVDYVNDAGLAPVTAVLLSAHPALVTRSADVRFG